MSTDTALSALEERVAELEQRDDHAATFRHEDGSVTTVHHDYELPYDYESPREYYGNLGVMLCEHGRYDLGDSAEEYRDALHRASGLSVFARWLRVYHGTTVILKLGLIDHSGISMYVGGGAHWADPGGWDSGTVGVIFDTAATREASGVRVEDVREALASEVEVYDLHLRGDYYYAHHLTPKSEPDSTVIDFAADPVEAYDVEDEDCYGFLAYEDLRDIAASFTSSPIVS